MSARMPWVQAVALFGENALKQGHSHQRVSNWRRDGVPGAIYGPLSIAALDHCHLCGAERNPIDWWART